MKIKNYLSSQMREALIIFRECWGSELSLPMHGAWKAGAVQALVAGSPPRMRGALQCGALSGSGAEIIAADMKSTICSRRT